MLKKLDFLPSVHLFFQIVPHPNPPHSEREFKTLPSLGRGIKGEGLLEGKKPGRYEGKPFVLYGTKSEIIGTLGRHGILNEKNKAQIEANVIVKEDDVGQSFFAKVYKDGKTQYIFVRSSDRYTLVTMPGSKVLRDQWLEKYEDSQPKDVLSLALMET